MQPLQILQVSTQDVLGGAERIAWNLFQEYRARGHRSCLAVGCKHSKDPDVFVINNRKTPSRWSNFWWRAYDRHQHGKGRGRTARWVSGACRSLAEPGVALDRHRGIENFHFPGTWCLLETGMVRPDIVHCHNLHGGYFDMRALPWLSRHGPLVVTMHDAWLLGGHCAHSLDCGRWRNGCGECPYLTVYPAARRDATAYNWRRKRDIYAQCRLHIAVPCEWLMDKVSGSMLTAGLADARIIPNGVDLSLYRPGDKRNARRALGMEESGFVLVFAANAVRRNVWKDFRTLRKALQRAAGRLGGREVRLLALGEDAPAERVGPAEIRFIPYLHDAKTTARYYQAADLYVHAAKADTFPNSILEALACGTPVVATSVGGIPEQVKALAMFCAESDQRVSVCPAESATGALVREGDVGAMADAIEILLGSAKLRSRLGANAAGDARRRFGLRRQVDAYLGWYREILQANQGKRAPRNSPCGARVPAAV